MIELNNLVLNAASTVEQTIMAQDVSMSEELSDSNENLLDTEASIDPDSFMILMAQVITNHINQPVETDATPVSMDNLNPGNEDNIDTKTKNSTQEQIIADEELITSNKAAIINTQHISFSEIIQDNELLLDDNVALAWINSEYYKPLKTDPSVIEISGPKSQASVENNPLLSVNDDLINDPKSLSNDKSMSLFNEYFKIEPENKPKLEPIIFDTISNSPITDLQPKLDVQSSNISAKTIEIPVDVRAPQWSEKFSEHIVWLGQQGIKSALIKVHPEDLGPIEISIKVVKDSASVSITSHSSQVRDIVELSLPRLRDMMAAQGLDLSETNISADTTSRHSSQQNSHPQSREIIEAEDEVLLTPLKKRLINGLIDYFA